MRHRPRFTRTNTARRHSWRTVTEFASGPKPKFTGTGIAPATLLDETRNSREGATTSLEGAPVWRVRANCRKTNAESVIDLDR